MKVMVVKRQSTCMCLQVLDTACLTRNAFVNYNAPNYTLVHTKCHHWKEADGQMTQKQYATPLSSKLGAK